jgi:hypothetical protein
LEKAFNLPADDQKARGRNWQGFQSDNHAPKHKGEVELLFTDGGGEHVAAAIDAHGLGLGSEWKRGVETDTHASPIGWIRSPAGRSPIAWRWSREGWEEPGAMLFLSCWGWTRQEVLTGSDWVQDAFNREVIEHVFEGYRSLNRAIVGRQVLDVLSRRHTRMTRLERLAGETVRLPNRTGREKDYHRLLVNDAELCVDLIGWRALVGEDDGGRSQEFRQTFRAPAVVNEPGHDKSNGRKGRLDILLSADRNAENAGNSLLAEKERGPVAWVELEAGPLHLHQIQEFLAGEGRALRRGDYVCAVDRSGDGDPGVVEARRLVEGTGAHFLHAQVPWVFGRLEEAYAPKMHSLSRRRYTLEVIRGLLG